MPIQRVAPAAKSGPNNGTATINEISQANKNISGRKILPVIFVVIFLAVVGGLIWTYKGYSDMKKKLAAASAVQNDIEKIKQENMALIKKVGEHILLPDDEVPSIATITNAEALKIEQPFYRDAKDGNRVIIYMQAKKAIIFDEEKNILVNVGPIFVNDQVAQTSTVPAVAGEKVYE